MFDKGQITMAWQLFSKTARKEQLWWKERTVEKNELEEKILTCIDDTETRCRSALGHCLWLGEGSYFSSPRCDLHRHHTIRKDIDSFRWGAKPLEQLEHASRSLLCLDGYSSSRKRPVNFCSVCPIKWTSLDHFSLWFVNKLFLVHYPHLWVSS